MELLGTCSESIERAEDRERFKKLCEELGEPVLPSVIANTVDEAIRAAGEIGYWSVSGMDILQWNLLCVFPLGLSFPYCRP